MIEEEYRESTVSSSIFYAKKNSPSRQRFLLSISGESSVLIPQTDEANEIVSDTQLLKDEKRRDVSSKTTTQQKKRKKERVIKEKKVELQHKLLSHYYPEIPKLDKVILKKSKRTKRKTKVSPTKLLLKSALKETKKKLETKKKINTIKGKQIKKLEITNLNRFIKFKKISLSTSLNNQKNIVSNTSSVLLKEEKSTLYSDESVYDTQTPFPFTRLTEWLIWHKNYPELAYVREIFDLNEIPDESDEVFWVNIMNEPEFLTSRWKMVGSIIEDMEALKSQRLFDHSPDWEMDQGFTDGLSTYFKDMFQIIKHSTNGIQNYRYPMLFFALKGLLLLDLVYFDSNTSRWFSKGTIEEMNRRVKELDNFMEQQDTIHEYQKNIKMFKSSKTNDWHDGIICFDLLITKSLFLTTFFETKIKEEDKLRTLKEENFFSKIISNLQEIQFIDKPRVISLLNKLEAKSS